MTFHFLSIPLRRCHDIANKEKPVLKQSHILKQYPGIFLLLLLAKKSNYFLKYLQLNPVDAQFSGLKVSLGENQR